jgi:methionyl-tRNA formyltransferase
VNNSCILINRMEDKLKITILIDNPKSWIMSHAESLFSLIKGRNHDVSIIHDAEKMEKGDVAFFLSCEKIVPKSIRERNVHNLIVHSSSLPKGRGMSPLTWQILEGKNEITNTLFEAEHSVDSGVVYFQNSMRFEGHELLDELHRVQGEKIKELVLKFIDCYPNVEGKEQEGEPTYYKWRTPADGALDINLPLRELFNQLRIADNEKYPAFFEYQGKKYFLRISKA